MKYDHDRDKVQTHYINFEENNAVSVLSYLPRKITREKQTLSNFLRDLWVMTINYVKTVNLCSRITYMLYVHFLGLKYEMLLSLIETVEY